jgi:hypothetical protein
MRFTATISSSGLTEVAHRDDRRRQRLRAPVAGVVPATISSSAVVSIYGPVKVHVGSPAPRVQRHLQKQFSGS